MKVKILSPRQPKKQMYGRKNEQRRPYNQNIGTSDRLIRGKTTKKGGQK